MNELEQAAEILGQSRDTAKRKLTRHGWQPDGTVGGRGVAAGWTYQGPVDPFGSPAL